MNWLHWALLSALFAGLTAVLAKAGVKGIDSNLATAIRAVVILVFAWSIALYRGFDTSSKATTRTWLFLILSGLATGHRGCAISAPCNLAKHPKWHRLTSSVSWSPWFWPCSSW